MIQAISGTKNDFKNAVTQKYLVFQPVNKYFEKISNNDHISEWKSKGLFDEVVKPPAIYDNGIAPAVNNFVTK